MKTQVVRYHDFSAGHRVTGHENKCRFLHGHNYRVHFTLESKTGLDQLGRVLDFSVIKSVLCDWLEKHWDHQFLIWEEDPMKEGLLEISSESIVVLPFNPTAENMAQYLIELAPTLLPENITLTKVVIEETRKCSASVSLE